MKWLLVVLVLLVVGCAPPREYSTFDGFEIPYDCEVRFAYVDQDQFSEVQSVDGIEILKLLSSGESYRFVVFYRKAMCGEVPEWLSR